MLCTTSRIPWPWPSDQYNLPRFQINLRRKGHKGIQSLQDGFYQFARIPIWTYGFRGHNNCQRILVCLEQLLEDSLSLHC